MNILKNFCQISCPPAGSGHNRQGPQLLNFKHIQDCDSHLSGNIPQVVRNKKAEYPVITLIHHHDPGLSGYMGKFPFLANVFG